MDKIALKKRLLKNAISFLEKSLHEFKENSKFSLLHFTISVELFLKARLIQEHWSLIVHKAPNLRKFKQGDFISINLSEAICYLDEVLLSPISEDAKKAFERLVKHRNRIVHFFHNDFEENKDKSFIIKELCRCWFHLNRLLMETWSENFLEYKDDLNKLNADMKRFSEMLKVTYSLKKAKIKRLESEGKRIINCPSCNFDSLYLQEREDPYYKGECLVCDLTLTCIEVACPQCEKEIMLFNSEMQCNCDYEFTPNNLVKILDEGVNDPRGGEYYEPADCSCGEENSVVLLAGKYFCCACFESFERVHHCEYCNHPTTDSSIVGDAASYIYGCNQCDGKGLDNLA